MTFQPTRRSLLSFVPLIAAAPALSACSGGASDTAGATGPSGSSSTTLTLVAYAVPKPGFDKVIPAFQSTSRGSGVQIQQSYGASGDQSRKVEAGAPADVVNFSVAPDVTRLVKAGLVDEGWDSGTYKGVPYHSVVTIVVRKGNPHHIKNWDDLLASGLEVVTPNPFSSGSAKWNLLAPYAAASQGGTDPAAGLQFVRQLVSHVKVQPKSGREATETFLQGTGDVLLSYEDEALFTQRSGEAVQHVTPATTFRIDTPVAVLKKSAQLSTAQAFVDFLYTPQAQTLWAEAGFRPSDPAVARKFAADFPEPTKLWSVDDLGGWKTVNDSLFDPDKGAIAKIYNQATQ